MLKKGASSQILMHSTKDKVVLLIHCFRNNPMILSEICELLFKNGFSVYNLRLPGHGLKNEDEILKVKLKDWLCAAENVFLDLSDNFKKVYLCGLSVGATICIDLMLKYDNIKKAVLYSPFLKPRQKFTRFSFLMKLFNKKLKPSKPDCSIGSIHLKNFISFFPFPQGYECIKLAAKVRKRIIDIQVKCLCFLALNDHDMNYSDQKRIIDKNNNLKLITLEKSFHLIPIDVEKDFVNKKTIEWFLK